MQHVYKIRILNEISMMQISIFIRIFGLFKKMRSVKPYVSFMAYMP